MTSQANHVVSTDQTLSFRVRVGQSGILRALPPYVLLATALEEGLMLPEFWLRRLFLRMLGVRRSLQCYLEGLLSVRTFFLVRIEIWPCRSGGYTQAAQVHVPLFRIMVKGRLGILSRSIRHRSTTVVRTGCCCHYRHDVFFF